MHEQSPPPTPASCFPHVRRVGILQWFWYQEHELVERAVEDLLELGITDLRTGLSWADSVRPGGWEWLDWLVDTLTPHFDVLPCLTFTPPDASELGHTASAPLDLDSYAAFVDEVARRYGERFEYLQLWNEPNNDANWNTAADPRLEKFGYMLRRGAAAAHRHGLKATIGGISPIERFFFSTLEDSSDAQSTLSLFDAVGVHGFAGTLEEDWCPWPVALRAVRTMLDWLGHEEIEIWIDEVGYPWTGPGGEAAQQEFLLESLRQPVERVYIYSLYDIPPRFRTHSSQTTGERENPLERTCGLITAPSGPDRRTTSFYTTLRNQLLCAEQ